VRPLLPTRLLARRTVRRRVRLLARLDTPLLPRTSQAMHGTHRLTRLRHWPRGVHSLPHSQPMLWTAPRRVGSCPWYNVPWRVALAARERRPLCRRAETRRLVLQMEPDERAIRETHSVWIEAVNAGDLACLFTMMTDDVVFLNPGRAAFGRDGFSAAFSAAHERAQLRCVSDLEEVVVVGEVAYTRSRDALSVIPRVAGEATHLAGHRITVYRKEPGGRWLLARDAHTLTPVKG
jgi:uncharacterized protein (TIGR02246 family)